MRVGLDFDGVISDCGQLKSRGAQVLYGINIPPHRFKKEIIIGEGLLTAEQYRALQKSVYGTREMGFQMELVPGAKQHILQLINEGHEILVVTSREGIELEIAQEWARMQGISLTFVGVGYNKSKADAARGLCVYIDDDLDKVNPLVDVVPHRFLFSWGYNKHVAEGEVARRIESWAEFYRTIQTLSLI